MQNFYKGKKVFITGHTGFKGSWLCAVMLMSGAEVKGYSLEPNTKPALFNLLNLKDKMQSVFGDILDENKLTAEMTSFKPDIVFHLAAQPLVRLSYKEPVLTLKTNVIGSANVFEAVRKTPSVKVILNVTSDKCYENRETNTPYKETDPMGGFDPYSASKGMAELLANCYRRSFFNPEDYDKTHCVALASCRAGNVIGGGDYALDRIVPDCARALSQNKEIVLRNPYATRPWQHVLEPLFGYMLVAKKAYADVKFAQGWNFGPNPADVRTVEDLVKKFITVWGCGKYRTEGGKHPHEAKLLNLDITKAAKELNWHPVYAFDKAVEQTALWYKHFYDGADIAEFTLKQIKEYTENYGKLNKETD